jgi:16S rRNA (cytosine1402-N4)-methyltransferase
VSIILFMIKHVPVMLDDVINNLPENLEIVVDGTLWHGWHSWIMLERFSSIKKLIWFDLDPNILLDTKDRLSKYSDKIEFIWRSYTEIESVLSDMWGLKIDFMLLDLWVNMEHFKDWTRGFSLNYDAPLDMRFDNKNKWLDNKTAYDIINKYNIIDLTKIFVEYAEFTEQKSQEIAREIVRARKSDPIKTTFDLKNVLSNVWLWQKASVVIFQAIRIETNKEIDNLKLVLNQIPNILSNWWRCGIITFHSIEDRIVKLFFKKLAQQDWFNLVFKKAVKPHYKEVEKNRASRSAKYRIIEKI